jgi:cell division protein FtsQ
VTAVTLSPRGGWTLTLASGAEIAIGREHPRERLKRFLDAWPKLAAGRANSPAYIDLRYANGFAVRWAGAAPAAPTPAGIGNRESGIGEAGVATRASLSPFPIPYSPFPALNS